MEEGCSVTLHTSWHTLIPQRCCVLKAFYLVVFGIRSIKEKPFRVNITLSWVPWKTVIPFDIRMTPVNWSQFKHWINTCQPCGINDYDPNYQCRYCMVPSVPYDDCLHSWHHSSVPSSHVTERKSPNFNDFFSQTCCFYRSGICYFSFGRLKTVISRWTNVYLGSLMHEKYGALVL